MSMHNQDHSVLQSDMLWQYSPRIQPHPILPPFSNLPSMPFQGSTLTTSSTPPSFSNPHGTWKRPSSLISSNVGVPSRKRLRTDYTTDEPSPSGGEDEPKPKFTRSTRPCNRCRILKVGCVSAEQGLHCQRCLVGGHECIFKPEMFSKRRKPERSRSRAPSPSPPLRPLQSYPPQSAALPLSFPKLYSIPVDPLNPLSSLVEASLEDQRTRGITTSSTSTSSKLHDFPPPPNLTPHIAKTVNQYVAGGGFGDVYRCWCYAGSPKEVAVKAFRFKFATDGGAGGGSAKMLRRELGIWRRLDHKNIVPFLGIAYGFGMVDAMSLVSLWMPNESLHRFLAKHDNHLGPAHRMQLLVDIANGLHYLHSFPIVHGDLNSNNVLLDEDYTARLTDFGYASLVGNIPEALCYLQRSTARPGALRWIAPEQVDPEGTFNRTTNSDIYSFGCVALQVLSGKQPWSELREEMAIVLRLAKGEEPGRPQSRPIADLHWNLIRDCWSQVKERPTPDVIISTLQRFLDRCPPSPRLRDSVHSCSDQTEQELELSTRDHALTECLSTKVMQEGSPRVEEVVQPALANLSNASPPSPSPLWSSSPSGIGSNRKLRVRQSTFVPGWVVPPRVLLVDDDVVTRRLSSKYLHTFGCVVDVVVDGVGAVTKMNLEKYDLVLMDIVMPNMGGISATSLIRQFDHTTPIISVTSNAKLSEAMTYGSSGMNDILPKPFTKQGLLDMLEKHLTHLKVIQQPPEVPEVVGIPPLSDGGLNKVPATSVAAPSSSTMPSYDDDWRIDPLAGLSDEYWTMLMRLGLGVGVGVDGARSLEDDG